MLIKIPDPTDLKAPPLMPEKVKPILVAQKN